MPREGSKRALPENEANESGHKDLVMFQDIINHPVCFGLRGEGAFYVLVLCPVRNLRLGTQVWWVNE